MKFIDAIAPPLITAAIIGGILAFLHLEGLLGFIIASVIFSIFYRLKHGHDYDELPFIGRCSRPDCPGCPCRNLRQGKG